MEKKRCCDIEDDDNCENDERDRCCRRRNSIDNFCIHNQHDDCSDDEDNDDMF